VYRQLYDPVAHSLGVSSIFAALALLVLFVLLGALRWKAHWAALVALGVSLVVAIVAYHMPVGQALDSAAEGAAFGFYPIMWIVINAIWIYNMTRETGHFEVLGRSFSSVSNDQRIQAIWTSPRWQDTSDERRVSACPTSSEGPDASSPPSSNVTPWSWSAPVAGRSP
jgi:lactate permease